MKLKKLQFVVEDGVGIITMNYMKNLNAIDDQMADELMYVVDTCENDPNVKVVVLKGMPKAFSGNSRATNSTMAMAADTVIVEVGELGPELVL